MQNVILRIVLHCKAGKGRAGLMSTSLLIHTKYCPTAKDALDHYNNTRVVDQKGLTVASQIKWVRQYEKLLSNIQNGPWNPTVLESQPIFTLHSLQFKNFNEQVISCLKFRIISM